jgi:hypothetical protein
MDDGALEVHWTGGVPWSGGFSGLVGFPGLVDSLDWLVQGPVGSLTCQFTDRLI